tara:strand:+ start:15411 stop:15725 length:315 start_codon:yes stop_codon:yes gene_type:complete
MAKKKKEKEEKIINEKDLDLENPELENNVAIDTPVKQFLVNYTGEQHTPEDDHVTVGMIVETVAKEFPEFLMAVAEENWIRGYHQAMHDVEEGEKILKNEKDDN